MKSILPLAIGVFLLAILPAHAAFNGMFIFGDGLSATADSGAPGGQYFYGQRWSNGRVWVEVLAQRQGATISNNISYFEHNSAFTVTNVNNFTAPADATNDLFVVWVCNSDTFDAATAGSPLTFAQWQATNALSQTNHFQIITNLYAKGVRTLLMPNAVDLSKIPAFNAGTLVTNIRAGCIDYNFKFSNTVSRALAACPGLKIYVPDYFTLLNNVITNAASYGLTNALSSKGFSIDAYDDATITNLTLNGQGTNYIFWDAHDPTAKFHEIIADVAQQILSPAQISGITMLNGSNRLDVANYPAGLNGYVEVCTNLAQTTWSTTANLAGTNTTQSVLVPASGPMQFYRLWFPYAWQFP